MTKPNYTEDGKFIPDDTPVEVPLRFKQRETESMRIARMVTAEMSNLSDQQGHETFEESQDFEIEDDFDIFPQSQFEVVEMEEEFLQDEPSPTEKTPEERALEAEEGENDGKKEEESTEKNERETTE